MEPSLTKFKLIFLNKPNKPKDNRLKIIWITHNPKSVSKTNKIKIDHVYDGMSRYHYITQYKDGT